MRGRAVAAVLSFCLLLLLPAAAFARGTEEVIAPSDPHDPQVDSGWQAGTCDTEAPNPGAPGAEVCSVETPDWFFEQAAGHPHWGFTQFIVKHSAGTLGPKPEAELARVRVDLPVGLNVNPGATERCPLATFEADPSTCPPESNVGDSYVTAADPLLGGSVPLHAEVYNVVPVQGESARFGLNLGGNNVYLQGDADWAGNYHEGFTIEVPKVLPAALEGFVLKNRLVFDGRAGDGTFITTPSTCLGEAFTESGSLYSTYLLFTGLPAFMRQRSRPPTPSSKENRPTRTTSGRRAPNRRSNRRSRRVPRPKDATRSPTTPRWRSSRELRRRTPPPGRPSTSTFRT